MIIAALAIYAAIAFVVFWILATRSPCTFGLSLICGIFWPLATIFIRWAARDQQRRFSGGGEE